mmetsp:Transcript_24594/g.53492  ORF Transcript_24594/g.53492 Transcript_24594/m.53492 type:complete len:203 (-) Transcript_24594:236-844(-)
MRSRTGEASHGSWVSQAAWCQHQTSPRKRPELKLQEVWCVHSVRNAAAVEAADPSKQRATSELLELPSLHCPERPERADFRAAHSKLDHHEEVHCHCFHKCCGGGYQGLHSERQTMGLMTSSLSKPAPWQMSRCGSIELLGVVSSEPPKVMLMGKWHLCAVPWFVGPAVERGSLLSLPTLPHWAPRAKSRTQSDPNPPRLPY